MPQAVISVSWSGEVSLDRPKSVIIMYALSDGSEKRRFSGCDRGSASAGTAKKSAHLEITVDDAKLVEVVNGLQDVLDEARGVLLGVRALGDDALKELAAGRAGIKRLVANQRGSKESRTGP